MIVAVGTRCTDVYANELLVVTGCCVPYVEQCPLLYSTSHTCVCIYLVVMDRVDQPMPVALGCCTIINRLAATISVCVAYVVGFSMSWSYSSALVLCLRETET